jgi:hypothetical protein
VQDVTGNEEREMSVGRFFVGNFFVDCMEDNFDVGRIDFLRILFVHHFIVFVEDDVDDLADLSQRLTKSLCAVLMGSVSPRIESFATSKFPPFGWASGSKKRERLHDHLLAGKQRVADELASPEGNGGVGHFGGVVVMQGEERTFDDFQFSCGVLG